MKTPPNTCLIQADKDRDVVINLKGGLDLILPPSVKKFQEYHSDIVTQDGVVMAAPEKLSNGKPVEIKNGDHVYGHHFLCWPDKKVVIKGKECYANLYDSIYCKIDKEGNVIMVGDWNFVIPIYQPFDKYKTDSGLVLTYKHEELPNLGKIIYPSSELTEQGVKSGDIVFFKDNCEYDISIEKKMYYRIRSKHILGSISGIEYQENKEILDVKEWRLN